MDFYQAILADPTAVAGTIRFGYRIVSVEADRSAAVIERDVAGVDVAGAIAAHNTDLRHVTTADRAKWDGATQGLDPRLVVTGAAVVVDAADVLPALGAGFTASDSPAAAPVEMPGAKAFSIAGTGNSRVDYSFSATTGEVYNITVAGRRAALTSITRIIGPGGDTVFQGETVTAQVDSTVNLEADWIVVTRQIVAGDELNFSVIRSGGGTYCGPVITRDGVAGVKVNGEDIALVKDLPAPGGGVDLTPYALKTEIPAAPNLTPYALKAETAKKAAEWGLTYAGETTFGNSINAMHPSGVTKKAFVLANEGATIIVRMEGITKEAIKAALGLSGSEFPVTQQAGEPNKIIGDGETIPPGLWLMAVTSPQIWFYALDVPPPALAFWEPNRAYSDGILKLLDTGGAQVVGRMFGPRTTRAALDATELSDWIYIGQTETPTFMANTLYIQGFKIRQAGSSYERKMTGTSGATFVAADWNQI